ncbi:hypothetical protein [Yersinia aleksiciae]|uniref:Uncharacterized protein n=1 Tax=Yersinia aleksiciae TaxID=263819 RepID=A0A0T9SZI9_YERAE|nr:hypothetical protein [Yersinia aleksiciae]CNK52166.1 Uncharacterised protein [Yersinia aleksiciae]
MSTATACTENPEKNVLLKGEKIRSHIHRFDQSNVKALSGYSVSMNTNTQNWHPKRTTTSTERTKESTKALESQHITIQPKHESGDNDITFYLPKEQGNYRAEISNFKPITVAAESIYEFDFKAKSIHKDLVLFQVRELGGSMKTWGADRPPFSLHIQQDGMLVAAVNTVNPDYDSTKLGDKSYNHEEKSLKRIGLDEYYHLTMEIIMHRDHPLIKISIDDDIIYQRDVSFGALDSKTFYSKLGAYVPQQKNKAGLNDSKVSFDNIKEAHHQYVPALITADNSVCSADSEAQNSLPTAMATFYTPQDGMINVNWLDIAEPILILSPAIITQL